MRLSDGIQAFTGLRGWGEPYLRFGGALKSRVEIFDLPEKIHLYSVVDAIFPDECISYENYYEAVVQNLNLALLFSALPKI